MNGGNSTKNIGYSSLSLSLSIRPYQNTFSRIEDIAKQMIYISVLSFVKNNESASDIKKTFVLHIK